MAVRWPFVRIRLLRGSACGIDIRVLGARPQTASNCCRQTSDGCKCRGSDQKPFHNPNTIRFLFFLLFSVTTRAADEALRQLASAPFPT